MANIISPDKFYSEYNRLNTEQKQAVDTIEGPVMVIAGAGTGKTQTIALRIANILLKTQTPPQSILCLTYTETGVTAMRQRLLDIIGVPAYSIKIHTFHSFCNEVIKTNPEHFIFAKDIDSLEDLEKIEIIQTLIEKLLDGSILKPWGDHFYYQRDIIGNIQTLKRENISPTDFKLLIDSQKQFVGTTKDDYASLKLLRAGKTLESDLLSVVRRLQEKSLDIKSIHSILKYHQALYDSGSYDVGAAKNPAVNYKNALIRILENLSKDVPKQEELHVIYEQYQQELQKRGRYDFEDMILFALNEFKNSEDLLLSYQERFQYILVDEYQDTNSAQNEIISLLGSYFEVPNIFVVGDDDQSIFRFQGAAIENIYDFYKKYQKDVRLIVLKNNYRSHQLILDCSQCVIQNNKNRIANFINDLDKSLVSVKTFDPDPVNLFTANSSAEENYFVSRKIKQLIESGVKPGEIAVLFRNNADVTGLLEYLENMGVKYHLGVGDNVLEDIRIQQLIKILAFINDPSSDDILFQILSFDFLKINSFDLLKILKHSRSKGIRISDLIGNKEELLKVEPSLKPVTVIKLVNFCRRVAKSRKWLENYTLDKFYNKFIRRSGFLKFILSTEDMFIINHLNVFYSELKRLSLTKGFTLNQFLYRIKLLVDNRLPLSSPELSVNTDGSVRLMTVHKSKGLEFEHVFLIKCTDGRWGNGSVGNILHLPYGILKTELSTLAADENEDERRLFYVALTRAKNQIYVSYSSKNESGRDQLPSMFVSEIDPKLVEMIKPEDGFYQQALLASVPLHIPQLITNRDLKDYLKHYLKTDYKFNVTHLNSYLRCPLCFYYKTILRIPAVKNKHSSLGTAVHNSLSLLFDTLKDKNKLISLKDLLSAYDKYLLRENLSHLDFTESLSRGREILTAYYNQYRDTFNCNCLTEYDFSHDHVHIGDIPITGKIDKIEISDPAGDGKFFANVIDFKTGNPDTKSSELKEGGEYFRQLVFYKLLADNASGFKYHVKSGTIDFVQPSKRTGNFIKKTINITSDQEQKLIQLIKDVYQKILDLDFNHIGENCKDEQDLHGLLKYKHESQNQALRQDTASSRL